MKITCVIPAHNEGGSIKDTLMEIDRAAGLSESSGSTVTVFVSEDGSSDKTRDEVLAAARSASNCTIRLSDSGPRLGYSRAVLRGLGESEGDVIWFMDSDGQYDPADVWQLIRRLEPQSIVVGYRNPRMDSATRKAYSAAFRIAYRVFGGPKLKDPSSPFIVARRQDVAFLKDTTPHLDYGFWWEFQTRCSAAGLTVIEVPIKHRVRAAGETQVYLPKRIPGIVVRHLSGLVRLRRELRHG